jgi:RAP1 GTPase activating protein 1
MPSLTIPCVATVPHNLIFEREENYISYYNDYFFVEKEHLNFIGKDSLGPVIVSVANSQGRDKYRTLIINTERTYRILIPACKEKDVFNHIKNMLPQLGLIKLNLGKNPKKLSKELLQFENLQISNTYKWGVLYMKEGQNENDMYANEITSINFEEFLNFLGDKIKLKGWKHFGGGLDIKKDSTGTHSIYTQFHDMEIMFHVVTLLPFNARDNQNLERKRHLGNDIVIIIFKESLSPFKPDIIKSEFNHIFVVISKVNKNITITENDKPYYK